VIPYLILETQSWPYWLYSNFDLTFKYVEKASREFPEGMFRRGGSIELQIATHHCHDEVNSAAQRLQGLFVSGAGVIIYTLLQHPGMIRATGSGTKALGQLQCPKPVSLEVVVMGKSSYDKRVFRTPFPSRLRLTSVPKIRLEFGRLKESRGAAPWPWSRRCVFDTSPCLIQI
jgi:hypothetical protein